MFLFLHRLRGTYGWFSVVNAALLTLVLFAVSGNLILPLISGILYFIGETYGWGLWIGSIIRGTNTYSTEEEGENNGIAFLARQVYDPVTHWLNYCRTALAIRGMYWWLPVWLFPWFSYSAILVVILLAIGFPIAVELGKITTKYWNFKYMSDAWEHQEVWYGVIQDIALVIMIFHILN